MSPAISRLDSSQGIPLYLQLKELIRERIVTGQWKQGTQIPPESQLCSQYGISRITVRQALNDLVTEGWLSRQRGRGSFVRSAKPEIGLSPLFMLHRRTERYEQNPEHAPVRTRKIQPPESVRADLALDSGELVLEIARVRLIDERPSVFEVGFLPHRLLAKMPTKQEVRCAYYYDIVRRCTGLAPARTRVLLEAVLLGRAEARVLKAPSGSPAIRLERLTTATSGVPILLTWNIMAGDQCRYIFDLEVPITAVHSPQP